VQWKVYGWHEPLSNLIKVGYGIDIREHMVDYAKAYQLTYRSGSLQTNRECRDEKHARSVEADCHAHLLYTLDCHQSQTGTARELFALGANNYDTVISRLIEHHRHEAYLARASARVQGRKDDLKNVEAEIAVWQSRQQAAEAKLKWTQDNDKRGFWARLLNPDPPAGYEAAKSELELCWRTLSALSLKRDQCFRRVHNIKWVRNYRGNWQRVG